MSYKAYFKYSNALKNVRKQKVFKFYFILFYFIFLFFDRNCFIKKCTHFNPKFHTLKLIKLTNVRFYIEGFFLSFIVSYT